MTTQYDDIGSTYSGMKSLPAEAIERGQVRSALGDLHGKTVLDLACGAGYYSKLLISWGAEHVVGLDVSPTMIDVARIALAEEVSKGQVKFFVRNCADRIEQLGQFDIVLGSWLLNYAADASELFIMWQNIFNNLKPGGRFVGITPPPQGIVLDEQRYGLSVSKVRDVKDGYQIRVKADTDPPVVFENYYLAAEVYQRCASDSGMREMQWKDPILPEDIVTPKPGYWDDWLERPNAAICTAERPS